VDYVRKVTLDTSKDYTFTLRIIGDHLFGEVREVGGPVVAYQDVIDVIDVDDPNVWPSGFSGYVAYSQGPTTGNPNGFPPIDVTWDNFNSQTIPEPAAGLLVVIGIGVTWLIRRGR
jgi:hypothetical protein